MSRWMWPLAVALMGLSGVVSGAQSRPDRPAFDVVSVKANTSGDPGLRFDVQPGGRLVALNVPLKQFIRAAYTLQLYQIEGAPRWVDGARFDITAIAEHGLGGPVVWTPGTYAPLQLMMQSLLADRFRMKATLKERDAPGYALEPRSPTSIVGLLRTTAPCQADCDTRSGPGTLRARNYPLSQFAELLSQLTGRFVTDATGLTGRFDFELAWAPDSQSGVSDAPSLFTAVQEQLGLRLVSRVVRTPVLVIDSISRSDPD